MELYYYLILLSNEKYYVMLSELSDFQACDAYGNKVPLEPFTTASGWEPFTTASGWEPVCDWLLINKPLRVIKQTKYDGSLSLDDHVILYMEEYGMNNVRGGSIIDVVLSSKQKQFIQDTTDHVCKKQINNKPVKKVSCFSWIRNLFSCKSECRQPLLNLDD